MNGLKNAFFLIVGLAFIGWCFYAFLGQTAPQRFQAGLLLKVGEAPIKVEIADTDEERIQGLSGRTALAPDSGLFFIFDAPARHGIWMKDMNFPIDIIWIGEDMKIIWLERGVSPDTFPQVFYPELVEGSTSTESLYVLEVPAGTLEKYNIDTGDIVSWTN